MTYSFNLGLVFDAVVELYGPRPALDFGGGQQVTYAELNAAANRIASVLVAHGVGEGGVVAITGEKEASTFGAMLACLKLGAAYTMVDPQSPVERLRRILCRCRPTLALCGEESHAAVASLAGDFGGRVLERSALPREHGVGGDLRVRGRFTGETPAYIMFTSGSTGFPKGAVMTHSNVLNMIAWSRGEFGFGPGEVLTNVNPLYFDNSVFDFYSALFSGATLAPFDKDEVTDVRRLLAGLAERRCTSWFSVPSMLIYLDTMKAIRPEAMPHVRRIIFGGEGYPKARLKKLYDVFGSRAELVNVYGPTECTCICSAYRISAEDFGDLHGFPPLGAMIPNFESIIVDDEGAPVKAGDVGELCLLGPHVGKGYYNDQERTAEAFVQSPLHPNYRETMYRTGDLVRLDALDGKVYILGRKDHQVKHMGYRIELEEIENALCEVEGVKQAAAVHGVRQGLSRIVALVAGADALDSERIRAQLCDRLPGYMIPSEIQIVDAIPRNANGKIDRPGLRDRIFGGG